MAVRIRIDLAYDGAGFHGWARQPGLRTVQGELEVALATVLRLDAVATTCAGRTDAGVHARGQAAHADIPDDCVADSDSPDRRPRVEGLTRRLNGVLQHDVRVQGVRVAPAGFDARFSALWRRYVYRICDGPVDPLTRGYVVSWPRLLDESAMNAAALDLLGEHDFAAFCKPREGATTVRTLLDLSVRRSVSGLSATVRADAFCHSMVRALMGCLVAVGEGRRPPEWAAQVLIGGTRDPAVAVMPAHGLTLEEVGYPADGELAAQALRARVVRTL